MDFIFKLIISFSTRVSSLLHCLQEVIMVDNYQSISW